MQPLTTHDTVLSLSTGGTELEKILCVKPNTQILDFRRKSDFEAFHLPNSVNIPLSALRNGTAHGSPFADPVGDCSMLEEIWLELEGLFSVSAGKNPAAEALMGILRGKSVLTMCYDGDSARVANSVLRAKGVTSDSIRGGYAALASMKLPCVCSAKTATLPVSVEA